MFPISPVRMQNLSASICCSSSNGKPLQMKVEFSLLMEDGWSPAMMGLRGKKSFIGITESHFVLNESY